MKLGRSAFLAGLVALGAWSVAACSSDKTTGGNDGGTGGSDAGPGAGGKGTGGKGGSGGSSGSTGGKAGSAGTGTGGSAGDGGSVVPEAGFDGGTPSVKITDPKTGETVSKNAEYTAFPMVPIAFKVGNFALMPPATAITKCPKGTCGHVHINVDGADCNTSGAPYNNAGIASPLNIDLSLCKAGVGGAHTVTISLHNTDHSDVDVGGKLVSDEILITAVAGDGGTDAGKPDATP